MITDDCKDKEMGWNVDCKVKKDLRRILNKPESFEIVYFKLDEKGTLSDKDGEKEVYGAFRLYIRLNSEFLFDKDGNLFNDY